MYMSPPEGILQVCVIDPRFFFFVLLVRNHTTSRNGVKKKCPMCTTTSSQSYVGHSRDSCMQ